MGIVLIHRLISAFRMGRLRAEGGFPEDIY